jgi:LMBR1 domain-containing protein 1
VLKIRTSFSVYVAALTGWIGWFVFVIFGGIGMASLPSDLLIKYLNRPVLKTPKEIEATKTELQQRTKELIKIGVDLKNSREAFSKDKKDWRARNKVCLEVEMFGMCVRVRVCVSVREKLCCDLK